MTLPFTSPRCFFAVAFAKPSHSNFCPSFLFVPALPNAPHRPSRSLVVATPILPLSLDKQDQGNNHIHLAMFHIVPGSPTTASKPQSPRPTTADSKLPTPTKTEPPSTPTRVASTITNPRPSSDSLPSPRDHVHPPFRSLGRASDAKSRPSLQTVTSAPVFLSRSEESYTKLKHGSRKRASLTMEFVDRRIEEMFAGGKLKEMQEVRRYKSKAVADGVGLRVRACKKIDEVKSNAENRGRRSRPVSLEVVREEKSVPPVPPIQFDKRGSRPRPKSIAVPRAGTDISVTISRTSPGTPTSYPVAPSSQAVLTPLDTTPPFTPTLHPDGNAFSATGFWATKGIVSIPSTEQISRYNARSRLRHSYTPSSSSSSTGIVEDKTSTTAVHPVFQPDFARADASRSDKTKPTHPPTSKRQLERSATMPAELLSSQTQRPDEDTNPVTGEPKSRTWPPPKKGQQNVHTHLHPELRSVLEEAPLLPMSPPFSTTESIDTLTLRKTRSTLQDTGDPHPFVLLLPPSNDAKKKEGYDAVLEILVPLWKDHFLRELEKAKETRPSRERERTFTNASSRPQLRSKPSRWRLFSATHDGDSSRDSDSDTTETPASRYKMSDRVLKRRSTNITDSSLARTETKTDQQHALIICRTLVAHLHTIFSLPMYEPYITGHDALIEYVIHTPGKCIRDTKQLLVDEAAIVQQMGIWSQEQLNDDPESWYFRLSIDEEGHQHGFETETILDRQRTALAEIRQRRECIGKVSGAGMRLAWASAWERVLGHEGQDEGREEEEEDDDSFVDMRYAAYLRDINSSGHPALRRTNVEFHQKWKSRERRRSKEQVAPKTPTTPTRPPAPPPPPPPSFPTISDLSRLRDDRQEGGKLEESEEARVSKADESKEDGEGDGESSRKKRLRNRKTVFNMGMRAFDADDES
ncbi:hypothetical protein M011DRAFT_470554 [Sporormia fimetaria CBS 119925]|uniref:Uncharacterized protein n=1 Tax=Sporormia fimetaria CBS 119925 TaxID=1340428 RepID=A0A6A6V400_9PLEO|nr:hypothetical protein M011DRAFT_470554 [Sporormia fimetaria CBS 119925]